MAEEKKNDQMSLRECGQHDHKLGLKGKLTGWGRLSALRHAKGTSRKARIRAKA